jgi:hypothetical protein
MRCDLAVAARRRAEMILVRNQFSDQKKDKEEKIVRRTWNTCSHTWGPYVGNIVEAVHKDMQTRV